MADWFPRISLGGQITGRGVKATCSPQTVAHTPSPFNGAIGIAVPHDDEWRLLPPLITAAGVNNERERPHIVVIDGVYHLFWSTQASVFAPGTMAPTGLYGMVAPAIAGPWTPIGGSGLVLANPIAAPAQAYSWLVAADRTVTSFVDLLPGQGFLGLPAPVLERDRHRATFGRQPIKRWWPETARRPAALRTRRSNRHGRSRSGARS
jgi:levansucrase